jgi:iron complex outermembrane receptor protein
MSAHRVFIGAMGALALGFASQLLAQGTGAIVGRVLSADTAEPVVGAFISIDEARPVAQSDTAGRFRIDGVAAGTHTLRVHRVGYLTVARSVDVAIDGVSDIEIVLATDATRLDVVTVIGSRSDLADTRRSIARVPGGVALVSPEDIRSTRQANLKDVLSFTPGVYVQPRFGAADESQISVRGSGLRNNFHARGINLLVNGMPYRNADGFTDFESLELLTAEAIEVYKGANALRYGGSTLGGAISIVTKTGHTARPVSLFAQGGTFGFYKAQLSSGAVLGDFNYYASYARTNLEGYRDWSDQQRDRINLHAGYRLNDAVDARTFYFFARVREHLPGALTRPELETRPEQAEGNNVVNRWGRDYDLHHVGAQLRTQLSPHQRLELSPYLQYRDIDHPIFEVIAQVSRDVGVELRYENTVPVAGRDHRLTIGVQPAWQNMDNRQFQNVGGEHGALTRDEKDKVKNLGVYLEDAIGITERLSAVLGARFDYSRRTVADRFLTNGDQSDRRTFRPITPRAGLLYQLPAVGGAIFANASRTVEPPLLLELSSFGNPGGFIDLDAQKAWQYEVGARGRTSAFAWEVSLYDIELRDEILNVNVRPFPGATFTVPSYRNAARTRHWGVEAGVGMQLGPDVSARLAYTFAQFTYVDDSTYDGNDIPGAPAHHLSAEVKVELPRGVSIAPQIEWVPSSYYVNSENTVRNDSWAALGLRGEWTLGGERMTAFVEGRNLFDTRYSASVQVDNAAGRFFEPADRRALYAGLRWSR